MTTQATITVKPQPELIVFYGVGQLGYRVQVMNMGQSSDVIAEYSAGNHPGDSQAYLPSWNKRRENKRTLTKWAKQTAKEMAEEYGAAKVSFDPDMCEDMTDEGMGF